MPLTGGNYTIVRYVHATFIMVLHLTISNWYYNILCTYVKYTLKDGYVFYFLNALVRCYTPLFPCNRCISYPTTRLFRYLDVNGLLIAWYGVFIFFPKFVIVIVPIAFYIWYLLTFKCDLIAMFFAVLWPYFPTVLIRLEANG